MKIKNITDIDGFFKVIDSCIFTFFITSHIFIIIINLFQ